MATCEHCGKSAPDFTFCTYCGAHRRASAAGQARARDHHFAAHPGEHVAHPGVLSTILPHIDHAGVHRLRFAYAAGLGVVAVLAVAGLVVLAIPLAIVLLPVIYLSYLRSAEVYGRAPLAALSGTVGAGLVLGLGLTLTTTHFVAGALVLGTAAGPVLVTIAIPLLEEIVKPLPVLTLLRRLPETVDGLVLGTAAGLGFAAGESLVTFGGELTSAQLRVDGQGWVYALATLGVFLPLLQGTTTGVLMAAVWRFRRGRGGVLEKAGIPVALGAHVAFVLGGQILVDAGAESLTVLVWQAAVVAAVTIFARYLLHAALLDEAFERGLRQFVCPQCRRAGSAAGFCPHCGRATRAVEEASGRVRSRGDDDAAPAVP